MKTKKILITFAILMILTISFVMISSKNISSINLTKGKNHIKLNITQPFYVNTLVKLNPDIETVSYKEENTTIGYVNLFEGIGKNFIIQPDKEYEITVKENLTLILPY